MKPPYPWFGGKSAIMTNVWNRLGDTPNFVDPFLGSNAPLLSRPGWDWQAGRWIDGRNRIETVNDKDKFVANFWRAVNDDPEAVARWADWPVNETDLHARHLWLVNNESFAEKMSSDPDYYDSKVAGWWIWGLCQWIGSGWCSHPEWKTRPNIRGAGMGVHRLKQQRPHLGDAGRGVHRSTEINICEYFKMLCARLRRVRVCCGDWRRVLGPAPTEGNGITSVILDPPYSMAAGRDNRIYAEDDLSIAHYVRQWAIANGDNPKLKIALFGYEDEHDHLMPAEWERLTWKTQGGYSGLGDGKGRANKAKERVWFSPYCLEVKTRTQLSFFGQSL